MKTKNLTVWLGEHTSVRTIDDPCRMPLAEKLEPGDVDDLGRIWVSQRCFIGFVDRGDVWVRDDQVAAAEYYRWQVVAVAGSLHLMRREPACDC